MKSVLFVWCTLLLAIVSVHGKTAEEWKSRVIYQILTDRFARDSSNPSATSCSDLRQYCGGTFKGIKENLDYIQGLGVNAIWISPIPQQTDTPWHGYHGYWQENIYNINSHYGTEKDLKELIDACHERDIWVMLDVVANHMGIQHDGDWANFTFFVPFDKPEHYNPYCYIHNFDNHHEVQKCRLANLPDLDESNSFVRSTLKSWVHDTVAKYGFDGIRVDTIPEVSKDFWQEYCKSAGVFSIGEAFSGNLHYVAGFQGYLDSTLNYPMFYKLNNAFLKKETMRNLLDGMVQNAVFPDSSVLGLFLDNHDNPRFLHINRDWSLLKNALAFIVFAEGIPIIYYGTEQGFKGGHDPEDRESLWPHHDTNHHLYQFISTIVKFRVEKGPSLYQAKQVERYVDDQFFAFTRGEVLVAVTNIGSGHSLWRTITYYPYYTGTKLVNILDRSDCVTVNDWGVEINIRNGQPKVYTPASEADCTAAAAGEEVSCLPDSPREDCGYDGVKEHQCLDRGCCWDPKINAPWCFYKTSLHSKCLVSGPRSDCGHHGIDKEECEAKGCCWHPMKNVPWCFHPEADSTASKQEL